MNRQVSVVLASVVLMVMLVSVAQAGPVFVATAKNFRGAMYLGYGPTPQHASEQAIVKCSQNSFIACTCRVVCMRMDAPPVPCGLPIAKVRKRPRRAKMVKYSRPYPAPYPARAKRPHAAPRWGMPMR
ncbi:hypothetical protein ACFL2Q_09580 [Thermodesulfobacteriota bacterium]